MGDLQISSFHKKRKICTCIVLKGWGRPAWDASSNSENDGKLPPSRPLLITSGLSSGEINLYRLRFCFLISKSSHVFAVSAVGPSEIRAHRRVRSGSVKRAWEVHVRFSHTGLMLFASVISVTSGYCSGKLIGSRCSRRECANLERKVKSFCFLNGCAWPLLTISGPNSSATNPKPTS